MNSPILQVVDYRRVETLTDRPGSEVGICVVTHEGQSFILEMSGTLGLIIADELAVQWARKVSAKGGS